MTRKPQGGVGAEKRERDIDRESPLKFHSIEPQHTVSSAMVSNKGFFERLHTENLCIDKS